MLRKNASPAEFRQYMQFILDGAPAPVPAYLDGAEFGSAHLWTPPDADLPQRLHCANAVLVGDAAHPLLPFTSQGVSAALEDAVLLADRLAPVVAGEVLLADALAGFCEARRRHIEPYVTQGRHILATFVDNGRGFAAPYVDGGASELEAHLSISDDQLGYLFGLLDIDGDGYLDRREFDDALQLFEFDLSQSDSDVLFRDLDENGDGRLKINDLMSKVGGSGAASPLVQKIRNARTPRRARRLERHRRSLELFRLADKRKLGYVEFKDFGVLAATEGLTLTVDELKAHIAAVDQNGDGRLDFRGAVRLFEKCEGDPVLEHLLDVAASRRNDDEPDPLFAHACVDEVTLRSRAFNHRWAEQPKGVIPLTAADPDFPVAEEITDAIRDYLKSGYLSYGPAAGLPDLRRLAALRFRERRAVDVGEQQVFITNSAASGLYLVASQTLQEGDEALVADPCDFLFERSVRAAGGKCVRYALRKGSGYRLDIAAIESLVTPRTKLLTVCNPHNPLGRVFERAELEALVALAVKHDLRILSDEVWSDIVFEPARFTSIASLGREAARRTFTVYGFSKGYGLAGLRLGLVLAPDEAQCRALVQRSHADETAYGVSTLSQIAGIAALGRCDEWLNRFVAHLQRQRDHAVARLNRMTGVRCHSPDGTFVVFPDVSSFGLGVEEIATTLKEKHGVAIVPGSSAFFGPGARGHIRLSLATSRRILDHGLDRLEAGLRTLHAADDKSG
jgi:aspartate/methionine/tyrosine aminotransferase/Ca2+-binding EF-hand superfamily protein